MPRNARDSLAAGALAAAVLLGTATTAAAVEIRWTDWTSGTTTAGAFQALGTITTPTATIDVTYDNPQGVGFIQTGTPGQIDYWQNNRSGRNPATSPYTSAEVDNIPTGTDIIGLRFAGSQTLSFSQEVANLVFAFVSLNGNGYAFDQDFEILSVGNAADGNDCGYWGCGSVTKEIVDVGGGVLEYRLIGSGEPHGTIQFTGAFDDVSWRSLTSENWNGFTVGIEGTSQEVFGVPEPTTLGILAAGLIAVGARRRRG
ncbi:MAG: PEP-CTERM sorting domain-containing protein [Ectothiorhodospiraceae bacterium]|nr:PEP-CTERM sorting domain-containing protein [Chromatiales bacterium]MCP5157612.1 PEP-CTERM sorting domain-containing protein [Ectothiorhodospiraceae bacterium]